MKYGNPEKARESNGDYYKAGSAGMRVLLDNVGCYGDETTLASCHHRGWYIENCYGNTELAAVVCEPASTSYLYLNPFALLPCPLCPETTEYVPNAPKGSETFEHGLTGHRRFD